MSTTHVDESAAEITVAFELPQLDDDELEVTVVDHTVTVRGGHEDDVEGFGKRPARSTSFRREFRLPDTADVERLTARLEGSSLELHAPKRTFDRARFPCISPSA